MLTRLSLLLILLIAQPLQAEMRPVAKHRVGTPPALVLKTVLQVNKGQAVTLPAPAGNQAPYLTWLTDSHSGIDPDLILPSSSGLLYSVRTLANQLTTAQASVDYGVLIMHSPVLLITASTTSPLYHHLLQGIESLPRSIQQDLDHLFLPLNRLSTDDKQSPMAQLKLIEANIDFQVDLAIERYGKRIKDDRLVVVGAVLDQANSYGQGHSRLQIININGKRSKKKLHKAAVIKNLPPQLREHIGRLAP